MIKIKFFILFPSILYLWNETYDTMTHYSDSVNSIYFYLILFTKKKKSEKSRSLETSVWSDMTPPHRIPKNYIERAFWELRLLQASDVEASLFMLFLSLEITTLKFWALFHFPLPHQIQLLPLSSSTLSFTSLSLSLSRCYSIYYYFSFWSCLILPSLVRIYFLLL